LAFTYNKTTNPINDLINTDMTLSPNGTRIKIFFRGSTLSPILHPFRAIKINYIFIAGLRPARTYNAPFRAGKSGLAALKGHNISAMGVAHRSIWKQIEAHMDET
jgi:hypothetical protein